MTSKTCKVPLKVGDTYSFTKTISESDVYLFGGITGDFSQMHFNAEFMKHTMYKSRIAHGVLVFALGCTPGTLLQQKVNSPIPSASYGYDRLRFIKPAYIGDTITAVYTVSEIDEANMKTFSKVEIFNQHGDIVVAATHILKFFPLEEDK